MKRTLQTAISLMALMLLFSFNGWTQGSEDFESSELTASYANGSFVGNDGITWHYVHARNEGDFPIDGKGIMLRRADEPSSLSATFEGGIASFAVDTRKAFTGNAQRRIELVINGDVVAQFEPVYGDGPDATVVPFVVDEINIAGTIELELRLFGSTGNQQMTLDNLSWTGFDGEITQVPTPVISPNGGTFFGPVEVTIETSVEEASVFYSMVGEEGPWTEFTGALTIDETTTLYAYATKEGLDDSNVRSAEFVFPALVDVATVAELRAAETGATYYRLTGEVVMHAADAHLNRKYVGDETAAVLIYDPAGAIETEYVIGDGIVNIIGTLAVANNMLRFVPVADPGLANSTGNEVMPVVMGIDEITSDDQAKLVQLNNVSFTNTGNFANGQNYTLTDGENTLTFRTDFFNMDYIGTAIPEGPLSVTGVIQQFNTTLQITARNQADMIEYVAPAMVSFVVVDEDGLAIDNAVITLGDITNEPGVYEFADIVSGTYAYTVASGIHFTVTGEVAVAGEDLVVDIEMERRPDGSNCLIPMLVELPVEAYEDHTENYGNDFRSGWILPTSAYLNNNDVIFKFTLEEDSKVTGNVAGQWMGIFLLNQCPDPDNPAPVLGHGWGASGGGFTDVLVPAGDYYIVLGSFIGATRAFTLNLSAVAVTDPPALAVTPDEKDFGVVAMYNWATQAFTLNNPFSGAIELLPENISITGVDAEDFVLTNIPGPVTLLAGQSATVSVKYAPQSPGEKLAHLRIDDQLENGGKLITEVPLMAESYDPTVELPYAQDFSEWAPTDWLRGSVRLNLEDETIVNPTTLGWAHGNFANLGAPANNAAMTRFSGANNHWLITPPFEITGSATLSFDMAITTNNQPTPIDMLPNDRLRVLISTDAGQTWSHENVLLVIDSESEVSHTGMTYTVDIEGYTGIVKLAFYAERFPSVFSPQVQVFINNVEITGEDIPVPFSPLFQFSVADGNRPAWMSDGGHTERGFAAYGDNIYVASRNAGVHVRVLDRITGELSGALNTEGISGGTFAVNDVEVSADGVILAGNMGMNNGGVFKVYQVHETNAPELVLEYTIEGTGRFGDKFTLVGSFDDGSAVLYAADGVNPRVLKFVQDGTKDLVSFAQAEVITLGVAQGGTPVVAPLPDGSFYYTAAGQNVSKLAADGSLIGTIPGSVVQTGSSALKYLGTENGDDLLAVYIYGPDQERIKMVRVPAGEPAMAEIVFETPSMRGTGANPNGTGDIAFMAIADGNADLYVLATNIGIGGYTTHDLNIVFPVYEAPLLAGTNCENPMVMSLPVEAYQDNTEAYGNNYTGAMIAPTSNYLNGYDFVAQFTLDEPGHLSGSVAGNYTGLFIVQQCPSLETPAPRLAMATGSNGGSFSNVLLQAGTYFAIVSTWPAPNFTDFTLNLSFEPLPTEPVFGVTPLSWNFGNQQIGMSSVVKEFVVSNSGGGPLSMDAESFTLTGDGFVLHLMDFAEGVDIGPAESASFGVSFMPEMVGTYTATLTIDDGIGGKAIHEIALEGAGIDATLYPPFVVDFVTFPPANWTRPYGLLQQESQVITGGVGATWNTSNFANVAANPKATKINLYVSGTNAIYRWFMSPIIDMGDGSADYTLLFDLAVTNWNNATANQLGANDYFAVVISTDGGQTWSSDNILFEKSGAEGDLIAAGGETFSVDLSGYTGIVKLGFYAQRPSGTSPDLDLHLGNVSVIEGELEVYPVTFVVVDEEEVPVAGALVAVEGVAGTQLTDENGEAVMNLAPGEYTATVSKANYLEATAAFTVVDEALTVNVTLIYAGELIISEFPWLEGFEGMFPPAGWQNENWEQSTWGAPHSGDEFAYSNTAGAYMITPAIEVPEEGDYAFHFWYRAEASGHPRDLDVLLSHDGGENFDVVVLELRNYNTATYAQHVFDLGAYAGEIIHVKFVNLIGTGGWDYGFLLDDVGVSEFVPPQFFTVDFMVTEDAEEGMALAGAQISMAGFDPLVTDAEGMASVELEDGTYAASVSLDGYVTKHIEFTVAGADLLVEVGMVDVMVPPYNPLVVVDGQDALFSWNNEIDGGEFADGFESGDFDAWHAFIQGTGTVGGDGGNPYWFATDVVDGASAPEGDFVARADWGFDIDTWLISPLVEVGTATQISFKWYSSYYWSVNPFPNAELMVKVSTDGGETWTEIWNWQDIGTWTNFTWYMSTLDLDAYAGQSVHVAINLVGNDNAVTQIDDVVIGTLGKSGTLALSNAAPAAIDARNLPEGVKMNKVFSGYSVFLNGVEVASGLEETEYQFTDLPGGTHIAGVKSVYTTGSSAMAEVEFTIEAPFEIITLMDMTGENKPAQIGDAGNARAAAIYMDRYVVVPSREGGVPNVYVWDSENPEAAPVALNMGDGVVEGGLFLVNYVHTVGEHIYVSNMSLGSNEAHPFKVYRWSGLDAEPELFFSTAGNWGRLGDSFSIWGDPETQGSIVGHVNSGGGGQRIFYKWDFVDGEVTNAETPVMITLEGDANMNSFGVLNPIPGEAGHYLVTGNGMGIGVADASGAVLAYLGTDIVPGGTMDPNVFYVNDKRYLSYTVNNEGNAVDGAYYEIIEITQGATVVEALGLITDSNVLDAHRVHRFTLGTGSAFLSGTNRVSLTEDFNVLVLAHVVARGFVLEMIEGQAPFIVNSFPYFEDFEAGAGEWTSGAISGADQWQLGTPAQVNINSANSGENAFMTRLAEPYDNNANSWLMSPWMDFSELENPMFSVHLNLWSEPNWDAMILESSIDGGATWEKVVGDAGFYNNTSASGPVAPPKWSGRVGVWTQYVTGLHGLGGESMVHLRFRFQSDSSVNDEGIAVDDIRIWEMEPTPNPVLLVSPLDGSEYQPISLNLQWNEAPGAEADGFKVYLDTVNPPEAMVYDGEETQYLASLEYGTTYYWSVVPYNEAGEPEEVPVWSFSTMDDPTITAVPYAENFDGPNTMLPNIPVGWNRFIEATSAAAIDVVTITAPFSAPNHVRFRNLTDPEAKLLLITPPIDLDLTELRIRFYSKVSFGTDNFIQVGTMTDPADFESFSMVQEFTPTTVYTEYTVAFDEVENEDMYVAIRFMAGANNRVLFVDNFVLEAIPASPIFFVNPTEKDFGELPMFTASTPQVFMLQNIGVGTISIAPGDIQLTGDDAAQFELTNLEEAVELGAGESTSVSVRFVPTAAGEFSASLEIEDNLGEKALTVISLSGSAYDPVVAAPFLEDFNDLPAFPPQDWGRFQGNLAENTVLTPSTGGWFYHQFGNTGGVNNAAYVNVYGSRNHWLVTPPIDLGEAEGDLPWALKFDIALTPWTGTAPSTLGPDDYVAVVISTDGGITWSSDNVLIDFDSSSVISNTGDHYSINLDGVSGVVKFGFYVFRPTGNTPDLRLYIDNVEVAEGDMLYPVTFMVHDQDEAPVADAHISIAGVPGVLMTDAAGEAVIQLADGDYTATITKEGFGEAVETFSVDGAAVTVEVTLEELQIFTLSLEVNPAGAGTVTGAGDYEVGEEVTVVAAANAGFSFVSWNDGEEVMSTQATYVFAMPAEDLALTAHFMTEVVISDFPWMEDFEDGSAAWTIVDVDGGAVTWAETTTQNHTPDGTTSMFHNYAAASAGNQIGLLISPKLELPAEDLELRFWSYNTWPTYYGNNSVLISTGSNDPDSDDWTEIWTTDAVTQAWVESVVDLSAYAGQDVYLAFRYEGLDGHGWFLDDIWVGEGMEMFTLTFDVQDPDGAAINDAVVTLDGVSYEPGHYVFELPPANYDFVVSKFGYVSYMGAVGVFEDITVTAILEPESFTEDTFMLSWEVAITATTPEYREEHYSVWISTTGTNAADFSMLFEETLTTTTPPWEYQPRLVDISDYQGEQVYVAFRHHESTDMDRVVIDNVMISMFEADKADKFVVVFFEDFQGGVADPVDEDWLPAGWLAVDADGDGFNWYFQVRNGEGHMRSQSWDTDEGALTPDNWLITPMVDLGDVQPTFYTVTFNVDMTYATPEYSGHDFDPATDLVMITGEMTGWATPGDDPENQLMARVGDSMVWTITHELQAGTYEYKYFLNAGWDGGEWQGGDNRVVSVSGDMVQHDWFGYMEDPTSISDPELAQINLFPNPARAELNITSSEPIRELRMFDMTGRMVVILQPMSDHAQLNVSSLHTGMYFIQVQTQSGISTHRVQVNR